MGDVIAFPTAERPEPEPGGVTAEEFARYQNMLARGYSEDHAIEILALARWTRGSGCAD